MPICKVKNKQEIYVDACISVCSGNLFQMANTYNECQRFCTSWKYLCKNGKRNDCPSALCSGKRWCGQNAQHVRSTGARWASWRSKISFFRPWETHWVMWWQHAQMRIILLFLWNHPGLRSSEFAKRAWMAQPSRALVNTVGSVLFILPKV